MNSWVADTRENMEMSLTGLSFIFSCIKMLREVLEVF